jgi:hypothetical protein
MVAIRVLGACAALVLLLTTPLAAQHELPETLIRAELREFYRDYRANHWPDVLDHFWVGKITARRTAPTSDRRWLDARPLPMDSACALAGRGELAMSVVVIDDRWARVFAAGRSCSDPTDELWMLRVGEAWRIARMIPGTSIGLRRRVADSDAHFVQVPEQIGRVLIHAIRSRSLQLFLAVAAGQ